MAKTPKLNQPSLKLPTPKTSPGHVMRGLTSGLMSELTGFKRVNSKETKTYEKKPIGAGRGGKYYSENRSHYSRF